jgi:hypothetical protein
MKLKKGIFGFIICTILIFNIKPAFAKSILQKIEVLFNSVSIYMNNQQIVSDNILYKGTTYVPLRAISEMNGMDVKWNEEKRRVDLVSNEFFKMKLTDGKYNIVGTNPKPLTDGNYFYFKYLTIVFNTNTKSIVDNKKVILIDNKGNRFDVECKPAYAAKQLLLIVPKNKLELNTSYSLYIPKDNLVMENNDLYGEEILIYFKTATNVISGKISSDDDLLDRTVIIKDSIGKKYSTKVVGINEFYLTNIPSGTYEIDIEGLNYGNIIVEDNVINEVKVFKK